jgi:hypothetical protein
MSCQFSETTGARAYGGLNQNSKLMYTKSEKRKAAIIGYVLLGVFLAGVVFFVLNITGGVLTSAL